jgi:catechol 2,3-dioxygenase-like lactoylglutathione lyase family enzyme
MFSKSFSVAIMVSDAKKSARWYKSKLGLEALVEGHWVTVWQKGTSTKIHLCEGKLDPGNTGISFYTDDVEKTVAAMKKKGVEFPMDRTKTQWGELTQFVDPDGNAFWINQGTP